MNSKLEITSAIVLEETLGEIQAFSSNTKEVMIQIQYEEGNGRNFITGQIIVEAPTSVAEKIQPNRPVVDDDLIEMLTKSATSVIYKVLKSEEDVRRKKRNQNQEEELENGE